MITFMELFITTSNIDNTMRIQRIHFLFSLFVVEKKNKNIKFENEFTKKFIISFSFLFLFYASFFFYIFFEYTWIQRLWYTLKHQTPIPNPNPYLKRFLQSSFHSSCDLEFLKWKITIFQTLILQHVQQFWYPSISAQVKEYKFNSKRSLRISHTYVWAGRIGYVHSFAL